MSAAKEKWQDFTVRPAELAVLFGLTPSRISHLSKQAGAPVDKHGNWNLAEAIQWRTADAGGKDTRAQLAAAQAERYRILNAKLAGELVSLEDVKQVIAGAFDSFTSEMLGLPRRWSDDRAQQESMVDDIRDALQRASKTVAAYEPVTDSGADDEPPTQKERGPVGGRKKKRTARQPGTRAVANG